MNKASLPPNLYQLLLAIFSNNQICWIGPYHEPRHLHYTKLATKNLHLVTIILQLVAKRRPENISNFGPCGKCH